MVHCWSWRLPAVERYLRARLGDEECERYFEQAPKEKMASIVESMEAARNRSEEEG
jgi:predicted metalloendopeptidase